jgi:hypothetical protein
MVDDETKPSYIRFEALWWQRRAFHEGMRDLSRLMLWAALEAEAAQGWWGTRYFAFKRAVESGKLKLEYL